MEDKTNRDLIRMGFEFEFIYGLSRQDWVNELTEIAPVATSEFSTWKLREGFYISPTQSELLECLLSHQRRTEGVFERVGTPEVPRQTNLARIIVGLKLRPRFGCWYRQERGRYVDCTDELNYRIDQVDPSNFEEIARVARTVSRMYVRKMSRTTMDEHFEMDRKVRNHVAKVFSDHLGVPFQPLGGRRSRTSTIPKTKPGWYVKEEFLEDSEGDSGSYGVELVTPPLSVDQALHYKDRILETMRDSSLPFRVHTARDCGIHVNISHLHQTRDDINPLFVAYALRDEPYMDEFGRKDSWTSYWYSALDTIRYLVTNGILCPADFDSPEGVSRAIHLINKCIPHDSYAVVRFTKAAEHAYTEYRGAGGINYHTRTDRLNEFIEHLIDVTLRMPYAIHDTGFVDSLRSHVHQYAVTSPTNAMFSTFPQVWKT